MKMFTTLMDWAVIDGYLRGFSETTKDNVQWRFHISGSQTTLKFSVMHTLISWFFTQFHLITTSSEPQINLRKCQIIVGEVDNIENWYKCSIPGLMFSVLFFSVLLLHLNNEESTWNAIIKRDQKRLEDSRRTTCLNEKEALTREYIVEYPILHTLHVIYYCQKRYSSWGKEELTRVHD